MDWVDAGSRWTELIKKYRYLLLLVLAGVVLLSLPEKQEPPEPVVKTEAPATLEESLSSILSRMEGAGEVQVLLTQARGEEILYQTDDDRSDQDIRRDTVLITGDDRRETGLVRQKNPPLYQGAIILCRGAENPSVRLMLVEAVMDATGLTSDKITVLKMK